VPWAEGAAPKFIVDAPGSGDTNTNSMIGTYMNQPTDICTGGAENEAAVLWGGYSDWFLPAIDKLFTSARRGRSSD